MIKIITKYLHSNQGNTFIFLFQTNQLFILIHSQLNKWNQKAKPFIINFKLVLHKCNSNLKEKSNNPYFKVIASI